MSTPPSGTVTFLFTDIEGSTRLWQEKPQAMSVSHARHDVILREAIESHNGTIFQIVGDAFCAAFHNASDGVGAVLVAQRGLQNEKWGETGAIRVRMGLHTGAAQLSADGSNEYSEGYATIAFAQRVMSAAHGGQVLVSQTTCDLLQTDVPDGASLRDMGEHRLKDFPEARRLYQLVAPGLPQEFPPIKSLGSVPNNLPVQLSSFIGREKEIGEIKDLLNSARLVTLTGSGGTGKTRLSQEIGTLELAQFPQGVWLVELAPITEPAQIIPALAQVLGLQELPFASRASQVMDYLRDKKALLLLDNCEHLIQACARLAEDLLHQCSQLKIIASSREALGIAGELAYRIPSLADAEATRLFADRARAANSKFNLTDSNAGSIAKICTRLDGIPLAIELAAARVRLLAPEQIAARLDDRFRLLIGGSRTALPRQQTLRALIDWSYDLLSAPEQQLLRTASVFVGGWTLEALEAVAGEPNALAHLEQLVNKSLVVANEQEDQMRYFMLETIRQYAREKLFEAQQSSAVRDRHFTYFNDLSDRMSDAFLSGESANTRNPAEDELENFRLALEWGLENHVEEVLRLAASFCITSSWMNGPAEGLAYVRSAIERAKALPPVEGDAKTRREKLMARALFAQGMVNLGQSVPDAVQSLQEAIPLARQMGDKRLLGYCLEMYLAAASYMNLPGGDEAAEEGLDIFLHQAKDKLGLPMAYMGMARAASRRGDDGEKNRYYQKVQELAHEMPASLQVAILFYGIGVEENARGNFETARKVLEDALNIVERLHNTGFQLMISSELGHIARHSGDTVQARNIYLETIKGFQDVGHRPAVAHQIECFGYLALSAEEPRRALRLFGAAEALRERVGAPRIAQEQNEFDQGIAQIRDLLPEAEFDVLREEGRSMSMERAIRLAVAPGGSS